MARRTGIPGGFGKLPSVSPSPQSRNVPNPSSAVPANTEPLLTQAQNRLEFGDLGGAQKLLEQAIELHPSAEAYYQLGNCHRRLHQADQAEMAFKQALEQDPGLVPAWFGLCFLYEENGRKDEAAEYLSKFLRHFEDNLDLQHQAGGLLADFGLYKEAAALYEQILRRQPQPRNHLRLGQYYQKQGRYADAARELTAAVDGNPDLGAAYLLLAHTHRFGNDAQDQALLRRLTAAAQDPTLSRTTQVCLNFALGKIHDDLDDCDVAFRYIATGNALRHETERFSAEEWFDFARQIEGLRPSDVTPLHKTGGKGTRPLFIVGMLRSGTTLLERILASHPQVMALGEASWLDFTVARAMTENSLPYPGLLTQLSDQTVDSLREDYLRHWPKSRKGATYMVDKNPLNFIYLGLISRLFPEAKILHCRRDARDTSLSVYFQNFANAQNTYAYDLTDIGHFYNGYARLMRHWERVLPRGILHEVSYEAMVQGQEQQTRELLESLDLPWDERCLKFDAQPASITTASVWQARQPLYTQSIGRWRRYERHLTPLLDALESV
ncbi:MAG TPA: sulfotransferase [Gammaproteobacteria bacterium]|nr:sulfotransferase [Gammaproteobacteria bacterium]